MVQADYAAGSPSIEALLRPKSIAIAGASADPAKLGSLPLAFLRKHGYPGALFPINPKGGRIDGLECYRRFTDIRQDVDLLVIAVAAARIPELLSECRRGQVKSAIVLSSGYAESGSDGVALQDRLRAQASGLGIRFIGPNSVGLANLRDKVIPSISQVYDQPDLQPGSTAFVSQSGAMGTAVTALAHAQHVGIGYFVSTGNEGDLEFADFCDYFVDDPSVATIAGYLESVRDGPKFMRAVERAARAGKPVILLKVGATEVGSRAVRSHTGALAGSDRIYDAAFREARVIRAESLEQLVDYLKVFSMFPATRPSSRPRPRVAILSHSGGAGVLTADTCIAQGLDVPTPSRALAARLQQRLPAYASLQNPVDMTANVIFDPELMSSVVQDARESGEYDGTILCINLIWRQGASLAEHLVRAGRGSKTPLAVAWIASKREPVDFLDTNAIPVFPDPVRCAKAVSARLLWDCARSSMAPDAGPVPDAARRMPPERLGTHEGQRELFRSYGITEAPSALVRSLASARRAAEELGYPVAAKLSAKGLSHKSEIGAVFTDISSPAELDRCYGVLDAIPIEDKEGIVVQRMIQGNHELFAGVKRDEVFGPVVVFGLGGIYVELLRASAMRFAPFSAEQAKSFIEGTWFHPILAGARNQAPANIEVLAAMLSRLSVLAVEQPHVRTIDLNPIIATGDEAIVVDAKIEL